MRGLLDSLTRDTSDSLGRRCGVGQCRKLRLQVLKLSHQLVEFGVRNLRAVADVVEMFVTPDLGAQPAHALFDRQGRCAVSAHRISIGARRWFLVGGLGPDHRLGARRENTIGLPDPTSGPIPSLQRLRDRTGIAFRVLSWRQANGERHQVMPSTAESDGTNGTCMQRSPSYLLTLVRQWQSQLGNRGHQGSQP